MIDGLEATLGPEVTDVLLQHLPPPRSDLATKQDLLATKQDLVNGLSDVSGKLAALDQRVTVEVGGLRKEMETLRTTDLDNLRLDLIGNMHRELASQTKAMMFSLAGMFAAMAGVAVALGRILAGT